MNFIPDKKLNHVDLCEKLKDKFNSPLDSVVERVSVSGIKTLWEGNKGQLKEIFSHGEDVLFIPAGFRDIRHVLFLYTGKDFYALAEKFVRDYAGLLKGKLYTIISVQPLSRLRIKEEERMIEFCRSKFVNVGYIRLNEASLPQILNYCSKKPDPLLVLNTGLLKKISKTERHNPVVLNLKKLAVLLLV